MDEYNRIILFSILNEIRLAKALLRQKNGPNERMRKF